MTGNPILDDQYVRLRQAIVCALAGIAYAVCFGIAMDASAFGIAADSAISALGLFMESALLWSIFTYSLSGIPETYQKAAIHVVYVIVAVTVLSSLEYIAISLISWRDSFLFVQSLPARAFAMIMMYVSFLNSYNKGQLEESYQGTADEVHESTATETTGTMERIIVKVGNDIKVVPIEEIICLKAEDDYVSVITAEGHWLKNERLKDFEMSLPGNTFVRVHRSWIVNIGKISKIERYGQTQMLILNNGTKIKISAAGYKMLRAQLGI